MAHIASKTIIVPVFKAIADSLNIYSREHWWTATWEACNLFELMLGNEESIYILLPYALRERVSHDLNVCPVNTYWMCMIVLT